MSDGAEVDGVCLRVVECTGRAGDVYVTHPWVFHSIASNASTRPPPDAQRRGLGVRPGLLTGQGAPSRMPVRPYLGNGPRNMYSCRP